MPQAFPPPLLESITRDDVVIAGACREGVDKWANHNASNATLMDVETALSAADEDEAKFIREAAGRAGYGDGYGNGNGYGNGDAKGYGYGNGDGNGYGYGNEKGYGYGNGNGNGNGYGYGPSEQSA